MVETVVGGSSCTCVRECFDGYTCDKARSEASTSARCARLLDDAGIEQSSWDSPGLAQYKWNGGRWNGGRGPQG